MALKLELIHTFVRKTDGSTDYMSKMVEFDYSHLNEERRDVLVTEFGSRTYVTFARGLVVDYRSQYLGDGDSVGIIIVWDPIDKKTVEVGGQYENGVYSDGTRYGPNQFAEWDATPEVKAEYTAYKAELERKAAEARRDAEIARRKWEEAKEAALPKKGRYVRVFKGRKVPVGTKGVSFWYGQTQYGYRVGLETSNGEKFFTAADNVEVISDNLQYLEKKYDQRQNAKLAQTQK